MKNLLKLSAYAIIGLVLLSAFTRIETRKTKDLNQMIKEKILNPVKKADGRQVSAKDYSRCPSGYRTYVKEAALTKNDFNLGTMSYCSGCDCETICEFRIRESDGLAEIKNTEGVYISVHEWIALTYKKTGTGNS